MAYALVCVPPAESGPSKTVKMTKALGGAQAATAVVEIVEAEDLIAADTGGECRAVSWSLIPADTGGECSAASWPGNTVGDMKLAEATGHGAWVV